VTEEKAIAPWKVLESKYAYKDRWLALRSDTVELPNGRILSPFHVIEQPDWVNVIALTSDRKVVLVEEYRHGVARTIFDFPSGAVDDTAEEPLAAIKRELLEETGYASDDWHMIGTYAANAARQNNLVHAFLALDARKVAEPDLDEGEAIRAHEIPWDDFRAGLRDGRFDLPGLNVAMLWCLKMHAERTNDPRLAALLA
jgi:ADP-ribose pyrophosphatase